LLSLFDIPVVERQATQEEALFLCHLRLRHIRLFGSDFDWLSAQDTSLLTPPVVRLARRIDLASLGYKELSRTLHLIDNQASFTVI
jgi:hypothetical protein